MYDNQTLKMLELPPSDKIVVYIDEAGRGPLCFDVTTAAVIMPSTILPEQREMMEQIKDSKKISPKKREKLAEFIKQNAIAWAIGTATAEEIDKYNILNANFKAMHRALDAVYNQVKFNYIQVDGDRFEPWLCPGIGENGEADWMQFDCVVDGDATMLGIAAASIIAKVHRDKALCDLCDQYPELDERYGLRKNKGYGTKQHMEGLRKYGPSQFHRKSFAPVAKSIKD